MTSLPSSQNLCPRCLGFMPFEGPPSRVCRCGTAWEADLGLLIATLAGLLDHPGPPDPIEEAQ